MSGKPVELVAVQNQAQSVGSFLQLAALPRRELPMLLLLGLLARQSFSVDPASATLAGLLAVGGLVRALGTVVDVAGRPRS